MEDASDPPKVEAQNEGLNVKQQNTKDEVDRKPCSSRNAVKVQDIKDTSNSKTEMAKEEESNRKKELAKAEETKKLKELAKAEETKRQKEITKTEETPGYKKLKIRTDLTDSNSTVVKESNITYVPHQDKSASVKHINENILKETVTLFEKRTEICQNKTALSQSSAGTMTLVDPSLPPIKQEPADADNDVIVDLVKYERPGADLMLPGPSSSSSSTSGDKQVNEPDLTLRRARDGFIRIRPYGERKKPNTTFKINLDLNPTLGKKIGSGSGHSKSMIIFLKTNKHLFCQFNKVHIIVENT